MERKLSSDAWLPGTARLAGCQWQRRLEVGKAFKAFRAAGFDLQPVYNTRYGSRIFTQTCRSTFDTLNIVHLVLPGPKNLFISCNTASNTAAPDTQRRRAPRAASPSHVSATSWASDAARSAPSAASRLQRPLSRAARRQAASAAGRAGRAAAGLLPQRAVTTCRRFARALRAVPEARRARKASKRAAQHANHVAHRRAAARDPLLPRQRRAGRGAHRLRQDALLRAAAGGGAVGGALRQAAARACSGADARAGRADLGRSVARAAAVSPQGARPRPHHARVRGRVEGRPERGALHRRDAASFAGGRRANSLLDAVVRGAGRG
ncbi:DEAD (Asp-Glu-Ala-Asp) box polypeptide [Gracilaria domingensis]|nr:DEAD (Asp-Glu-Ala-Asp) box polypeptide [Gracilaria domingensis]